MKQVSFFDFFNEAEILREPITIEPDEKVLVPAHTKRKAKRGSKLDALPVETIYYEIPESDRICEICGSVLTEMKKEVRRELKIVPAIEFYGWTCQTTQRTLPQNLIGKAISYAKNQKEYLCSFLKDGRIQLSNNLTEQAVKPFVIGRKNWLFANTPNGAAASSLIYSVIQTAIANVLKPLSYLEYVFEQIQLAKDLQTEDLLAWSDKIPECCKNQKPSSSQ